MHLSIQHTLTYHYDKPVSLSPHYLYLTPRISPYQVLVSHELHVLPSPDMVVKNVDAETNIQHIAYINQPCQEFSIRSAIEIVSTHFNPFSFIYFPFEARMLPFAYLENEKVLLRSYLTDDGLTTLIQQTARELANNARWETAQFLTDICHYIAHNFTYQTRELGAAFSPEMTWLAKQGSCRDFAVLMIALCKAVGIAARFVSGYCYGAARHQHELHAWIEVFLPGGGWRGFDPTEGHAINENYVALAASAQPLHISPVAGQFNADQGVEAHLSTYINITQTDA